jgi:hypothetical protein
MSGLPLLFTAAGPVATPPATLNAALIAGVAAESPGYTASLPGLLVEDLANTATGAMVVQDQARVDAVNSVTPYTANPFVLAAQGLVLGVPQGLSSNASVIEVFTGSPGYVISPSTLVGDGTNTYITLDGGTVGSGGTSQPIGFIATNSGTFAIPAGSVNQVITSVPSPYTLTVTNPEAGVPALAAETVEQYRARVLTANQVTVQGTPDMVKTLVMMVPGVSPNLVSVQQVGTMWKVIVGGGDPFQVAGAIYRGVGQIGLLTGSTVSSLRNITASVFNAPDTYNIIFVNPNALVTTLAITWNSATLPGFTAGTSFNQLAIAAGLAYINGLAVSDPINLLVLQEQIQSAVSSLISAANLTTLQFVVTVGGFVVSPTAGTSIIPPSDNESYFTAAPNAVSSVQG